MIKSENLINSLNPQINLVRTQLTTLIGCGPYKCDTRLHLYEEVFKKDGCQGYAWALRDKNLTRDFGWLNAVIHVPI